LQSTGVLAGIVLASLPGCTRAAELQDQFRKPIIVLGHVTEVNEVGPPKRSSGDRRIKTQLNKIKINVEEVIKGDVRADEIEFYYFVFSQAANDMDLGVPRFCRVLANAGFTS